MHKELTDNSDEDVALPPLQVFTGTFRFRICHFAQVHQVALLVHKIDAVWRKRCGEGSPGCPCVANMSMWGLEVFSPASYTLNRICCDLGSGRFTVPFPVFWDVL